MFISIHIPLSKVINSKKNNEKHELALLLRGATQCRKVDIKHSIIDEDLESYNDRIDMGVAIFEMIHPKDLEIFIKQGISNKLISACFVDKIINIIDLAPTLLDENDKWFSVYLLKLLLIAEKYQI